MSKGKVKKLTDKDFGFITPDEGEKDLFFHASNLKDVEYKDLQEGDEVTFEVTTTDKGDAAIDVEKV